MQQLFILFSLISVAFCAVAKKDRVVKDKPLSDEIPGSLEYDHEAFLGEEQSKEFDQLSPEESLRRLGIIAVKLDKNGDGHVDHEELKEWITFAQNRYVQEDADNQFASADTNKNGLLEWDEYFKSTYGHLTEDDMKEDEEQHGYSYKKMISRDEKRWKKADENQDSVCNKNEFQSFLHPEEFNHMKDVVLDETLEDIDKDGDGLISLEEYINDMHNPEDGEEEPEWVQVEREQFTAHRDKDKSGKLDKSEVRDWILPDDYDHVNAEALHLMHEADEDQDGVLTKEEILKHHEVFVGSQITNYGEDLKRHDEF